MDVVTYIVVLAFLGRIALAIGGAYARIGPSDFLSGLFSAPTLGWPSGVQEEDRERLWSWSPAPASPIVDGPLIGAADPTDAISAAIEDIPDSAIPLRRVHGQTRH
jgi:hypothetical protein